MAGEVKGAAEWLAKLRKRQEQIIGAAAASLYRYALKIIAASDSIVPVATGRLRASHFVSAPVMSGTRISVRIGYGTHYALAVHENMAAKHEHGQAKYLELAILELTPGAKAWLAKDIANNIRNGVVLQLAGGMATTPEDGAMAFDHASAHRMNRAFEKKRLRAHYAAASSLMGGKKKGGK